MKETAGILIRLLGGKRQGRAQSGRGLRDAQREKKGTRKLKKKKTKIKTGKTVARDTKKGHTENRTQEDG